LEMRGLDLQFPCVTAKILHSMVLKSEWNKARLL
jgi:hypothetical protein